MKLTRRDVVIGSTAVGVGGCICSPFEAVDEVYEGDGLAARDPEDDEMPVLQPAPAPTKFYDPLHMTATVNVQANSQAAPNTVNLQNTTGQYVEILDIKFELTPTVANVFSGAVMGCQLNLGNIPVTNGFVPVWNFGPGRAFMYEIGATELVPIQYNWKLPRPLLIPPGAVLAPMFQHRGLVASDVGARISYACRVCPIGYTPPKDIPVPYAAFYASKVFQVFDDANTDTDTSNELDLVNRFNSPLRVTRFTGRIDQFSTATGPWGPANAHSDVVYNQLGSRLLTVRMTDSRGEPIIPNPTLFRQVFCGPTRTFDVDFIMEPKTFYKVTLDRGLGTGIDPPSLYGQAFIGMVGWHNMDRGAL